MFKKLFTKIFNELIKPFEERIKVLENRPAPIRNTKSALERSLLRKKKSVIDKITANANLEKYEKEYETFKRSTTRTDFGSEVEFYERGKKSEGKLAELKTQILHGNTEIEAFIARAKKGEVRLVKQIR